MLSRRTFLQLIGASLAASALRPTFTSLAATRVPQQPYQGRALTALPVFPGRNAAVEPIAHLWPDSMTQIFGADEDWYQVSGGWVQREGLQPMQPYDASYYQFKQDVPFWAEVAAPVAPVRTYCAADAPLVTRIGHGGVSRVIDSLPGEPHGWYGIADQSGGLLGWTQGIFWRPIIVPSSQKDNRILHINHAQGLMIAYEGTQPVLEAPFSAGNGLSAGELSAGRGVVGGLQWQGNKTYEGVGWEIRLSGGQSINGVYWHNRFGHDVNDGPAVQTPPLIARWLYEWLGDKAHVFVE